MDVPYVDPARRNSAESGMQSVVNELMVGAGARAFHVDRSGIGLGGTKFENCPFRVTMDGSIYLTSADGTSLIISAVDGQILHCGADGVPVGVSGFASIF